MDEESLTEEEDTNEIADDEDEQSYQDQEIEDDTQCNKEATAVLLPWTQKTRKRRKRNLSNLRMKITRACSSKLR